MSLYLTIAQAIKSKLAAQFPNDPIYLRERLVIDQSQFRDLFTSIDATTGDTKITGWMIDWLGWPETDQEYGSIPDTFGDKYRYKVIHIRGFQDTLPGDPNGFGSTEYFQQECEIGGNAVRSSADYNANVGNNIVIPYSANCIFMFNDKRMMADTLVHYAEIQLDLDVQQHVVLTD